ncbi:unnamed protein product [Penicillium salamii]|uniref:DH domain-containing protein n=1 Tax=Penicillium salamii TaxID=1612424 RepID=A0A9W4N3S9_9EURO|nr:unnamed protein product [Penicillium salamii]CAG8253157.1 unnamed protein product [Penicillium salamii]CAG8276867.1 unnamed protein product [Penicillium salamii]CAG8295447.1 unnamed protein product [Penicillium salamii]CAG8389413.1 unnamed protein product [Penicillium salamii]
MASIAPPPAPTLADLPLEHLSLYHVVDSCLSSILVFYGAVSTANATVSSSRIQAHIFTPAGFQSYPRITVSPAAPVYAAVKHLPRDKQGDEVSRGLAVSMLRYFAELSEPVKQRLTGLARIGRPGGKIPKMFDEMHAADVANRMVKVEDSLEIIHDIRTAYQERRVPWIDIDVVLPAGTIQAPNRRGSGGSDLDTQTPQYGPYTPLIEALGDPMFLPTSRLKRAPSQPTNVSKSRLFARNQKEALRLTMCELVDTEERYVAKLYSLVHEVADDFLEKAHERGPSSDSPDQAALAALFPPCLREILEVNLGFLDVIRQVLDETEKDAITDIGQDTELPSRGLPRDRKDALGAVEFAKALFEWLPRFSQPYGDYMRAHTGFTQTLNLFMRDKNSSFSQRVYETGEQRLRSLLMEPVQRLPRYSLLIDTMTSNLPLVHPAVRTLLKARDVVKDICALENDSPSSHAQSLDRLRELANGWPASRTFPEGRLITAVDFNEVAPPFQLEISSGHSAGIMLLYKNCMVLLAKSTESRATARGVLADIDNAASSTSDMSLSLQPSDLQVVQVLDFHNVRCMQSQCGRIMFVLPVSSKPGTSESSAGADLLALELATTYEGKASRLIEEISKAKIEGRFTESEREGGKWTLRSPPTAASNVGILACVCEDGQTAALNPTHQSPIRVIFDASKATCSQLLKGSKLEVIISISPPNGDHQYRLDIDSAVGSGSADLITAETFIPTLARRLQYLLSPLRSTRNPVLTDPLVRSNFEILRYVASSLTAQVKSSRGFRPPSPTKLISNLLGGSRDNISSSKGPGSATLTGDFPKMLPPRGTLSRSNTLPSTFPGKEKDKDKEREREKEKEENSSKISVVGASTSKGLDTQFGLLEQTFAAFVLSLQSRSGNILGRMLRVRDHVDRAPVNELYNILLEDPSKIQAAAEVPVDTLFVAFETFLANAWSQAMGPILSSSSLKWVQSQFDTMIPRDFDDQFRKFLADMTPQNRRALGAIIRLLAELLDASGNDGDRGALTMAFAEVLTEDGDPSHHVSLLDRLVEDFDNLFEDFIPGGTSVEGTLTCGQSKIHNTGSVGSNSSSFRKRFGFGSHKESSKNEGEGKVASILRTLSKKQSPAGSEPNTPKGTLTRSKSTDVDARLGFLRPTSSDRTYGFASEETISRPGTGHEQPPSLSSFRGFSEDRVPRTRRKRRSSLSDLRPPTASSDASSISPTQQLRPTTPSSHTRGEVVTPTKQSRPQSSYIPITPMRGQSPMRSQSPAKSSSPSRLGSPIRRLSPPRPSTPSKKENIDPRTPYTERATKSRRDISESPGEEAKRGPRASSIPQRTPGLRERPSSNVSENKRPQSSSSSQKPQRARMQSPQKLRERVQSEKKTQYSNQLGLRDEIAAISDELRSFKLTPPRELSPMDLSFSFDREDRHTSSATTASLEARMRNLEARFDTLTAECNGRTSAIEKDLESSLVLSERRVRKLDELYREASAENEALYDRFNTELSKIAKDVRSGHAEDALKSQLASALDEIGRVKKENFRLKREVGGLRAQSAAHALLKASEQ